MAKKDSKFDRVLTGKEAANRVMKEMDDPKSPWSKERAMNMAAGSVAGSGVAAKLGGTQPVSKALEMSKKVTSGMGKMKDFVKETHKVDDIARSKGVHKIKSIVPKGKDKLVSKSVKRAEDLGFKSTGKEKSAEKGFTKRGKPILEKIGDRGGEWPEHTIKKRLQTSIEGDAKNLSRNKKKFATVTEHKKNWIEKTKYPRNK